MTKRKIWLANYDKLQLYNIDDQSEVKQFESLNELLFYSIEHTPVCKNLDKVNIDIERILSRK